MAMTSLDLSRRGAWTKLFPQALRLMQHLESQVTQLDSARFS